MAWIIVIIAGCLEVVWAFSMKQSDGFSRLVPSAITVVAMLLSFTLLAWSMAYTVWTGIGAVGAFVSGVVLLGESAAPLRLGAATLILAGVFLMKVSSP